MTRTPVEVLKSIDILSPLTMDDLNRLYGLMNTEHFQEGRVLFKEGDAGETMYIVLTGCIAITVNTRDGEVLELAQIREGSFFGEMSIFDKERRSATCVPKCDTTVLTLKAGDFYEFIDTRPSAGFRVMQGMLRTTARRLNATGAFLSDMVTWGEKARVRAITDDFTGLYNRRFLEQAAEERLTEAKSKGSPLSFIMLDLDHFGTLNDEYGQAVGDRVILAAVDAFNKTFDSDTVPVRYGGDEFTFLLPGTAPKEALNRCNQLLKELSEIDVLKGLDGTVRGVSASMGIAAYPSSGDSVASLMEKADKALYRAKEDGRGRASLWEADEGPDGKSDEGLERKQGEVIGPHKTGISSLKERNQIISRIFQAISERDHFLLLGHKDPDEDCISSMIAMGLLINKFSKTVYLLIPRKLNDNFQYLLNICRYNEIGITYNDNELPENISTVFLMDTPKPEMGESFPGSRSFMKKRELLRIEIDHHLEADSAYAGDAGYCLVDEASSASELVGLLAFKLENKSSFTEDFNIQEIFSRNFVLAVLTGIIGDSKMGKYLKTRRERWFYHLFSGLFNEMLSNKTHRDSGNFSTMDQVFSELQKLSWEEEECYRLMMESRQFFSDGVASVIIEPVSMSEIEARFDHDTIVSVARYTADILAESSRKLSLVAYPDHHGDSGLIQFRVRRSQSFKNFDVRTILDFFSIENGGGHPGAIGFRIPEGDIPNLTEYSRDLIRGIEELM